MIFNQRFERSYTVITVTSCKGGTGKSTISANLSAALSGKGRTVLCIDCDYSNRSLDLIFGCTESVRSTVIDLASGNSLPEDTVVSLNEDRLYLIPGPAPGSRLFSADEFRLCVEKAAAFCGCDTVLIDTPGSADAVLGICCSVSDAGLIAVNQNPAAVRGAAHTAGLLESFGLSDIYLVINRFDPKPVTEGRLRGINSLIDSVNIPLIGVIPESLALQTAQDRGDLSGSVKGDRSRIFEAFEELAARITGDGIPLMSYYPERKRRRLIYS